ncbi:hypothetical protein [Clostridium sp. JS66]|uniref:hypothetical protein n=1 Tax=Clostridium sp. JS66 TaxID=3064705 RepID=UPI00298DAC4F|nr:hypothetical protein [Clostridium sp. JS66]WPC43871.1 hypothetical protein Q6H37_10450 [Clostridium sp. JS66]
MNRGKKSTKQKREYIKESPKTKDRLHWKVFFIGYLICCVLSICVTGVPKWTYLIPIKFDAILGAGVFGTFAEVPAIRLKYEKELLPDGYGESEGRWRSALYGLTVVGLMLIMGIIINLLSFFGIIKDIMPFMGIFPKLN